MTKQPNKTRPAIRGNKSARCPLHTECRYRHMCASNALSAGADIGTFHIGTLLLMANVPLLVATVPLIGGNFGGTSVPLVAHLVATVYFWWQRASNLVAHVPISALALVAISAHFKMNIQWLNIDHKGHREAQGLYLLKQPGENRSTGFLWALVGYSFLASLLPAFTAARMMK